MKIIGIIPTVTAAADLNSQPYELNDLTKYSIAVVFTGTNVVGTLALQASLDNTNYFEIPNSSTAVTASTGHIWDVTDCGYRYVRVAWDYTSGTGNMTGTLYVKEPKVQF